MLSTNFVLMLATMLATPLHFNDCVVVTKGFYEGCKGTVEEEWSDNPVQYSVDLQCKNKEFSAFFKADELKKCDK